jgi:hypothetical protein
MQAVIACGAQWIGGEASRENRALPAPDGDHSRAHRRTPGHFRSPHLPRWGVLLAAVRRTRHSLWQARFDPDVADSGPASSWLDSPS